MLANLALSTALLAAPLTSYHGEPENPGIRPIAKETQTDPAALQDALTKLHDAGVIDDVKLWTEYSTPGTTIESIKIRELMIAAANKLEHVDSFDAAMEVLKTNKVFANAEFWRSVAGRPKVSGELTALLIVTLARTVK